MRRVWIVSAAVIVAGVVIGVSIARLGSASAPASRQSAAPVGAVTASASPGNPAAAPSTEPLPAVTASATLDDHGRDVTVSETSEFFTPPTNIRCSMDPQYGVRCDIDAKTWTLPRVDSCEFDQGNTLTLRDTARVGCVSDAIALHPTDEFGAGWYDPALDLAPEIAGWGPVPALRYGSTMTAGDFRCTVELSGVTCTNTSTGAGFTMSREGYRIFG